MYVKSKNHYFNSENIFNSYHLVWLFFEINQNSSKLPLHVNANFLSPNLIVIAQLNYDVEENANNHD